MNMRIGFAQPPNNASLIQVGGVENFYLGLLNSLSIPNLVLL